MSDFMGRMSAHSAMIQLFDFIAKADEPKVCIGIRVKETGDIVYESNPMLKTLLGDNFKSLQDACDYDFSKDMLAGIGE